MPRAVDAVVEHTNRDVLLSEVRPFIAGLSLILWAWASWWIPALVLMWLWRYWAHRLRLTYESSFWSLVFPLGMYGAASFELGRAIDQPWLATVALPATAVGSAAWLWTFAAMALLTLAVVPLTPTGATTAQAQFTTSSLPVGTDHVTAG